ncbi:hypothetical protein Q5P01_000592 [Channa striata]|uniref:Uncharacterized protein n=1 Tax=Channa striata TaxID=64152 RepID=A0AA88IRW3_CHASR|nr:hypothetical protein Q5P01_000592 [Channa striata]
MEAATSTFQHSCGLGPPHGAQQAQGPNQSAPGPGPGVPCPEEQHRPQQQQHHKPFFYIQPSQPYLPMQGLQWPVHVPMPMSYNPFYGYPGLGYGMPVMPHYQPNPCIEPPGFVVPHTHLHLMDYRRMLNPQYYQTMAYHSRRFRYQRNGPTREMTSSEVQTEPLSVTQRTSTPGSSDNDSFGVLPACSSDTSSLPSSHSLSPVLAVQKSDLSLEHKDMVPSSTMPQNGSFVIQTEEVRIECCTTPVGLQLLHSRETAEMSHRFSQDVVQCSSVLQGHVLQDEGLCVSADESDQALQPCPDILLGGSSSTAEKILSLDESRNQMNPGASDLPSNCEFEATKSEKDPGNTSKSFDFKVVRLPFDPKCLNELQKSESKVWSMEDTLVPSPGLLIQNSCTDSPDDTVLPEVSADLLMVKDEAPTHDVATIEPDDMVPTLEAPGDQMVSEADSCPMMDIADEPPTAKVTHTAEVDLAHNLLLLDNSPSKGDRNQHRQEANIQDHQDTSFESLPAYLPSTSWLPDFGSVYYCSKMPPPSIKQSKPQHTRGVDVPSRRRKLDLEYKKQSTAPKPKERYKPKAKADWRSLSDHECCVSRSFNENVFSSYVSKMERLCSRCLAKYRICTSASPGLNGRSLKRKAAPFQQWNDALLPTCETCKSHNKRRLMRKGSNPDVRLSHHGHDTEGESSENSTCRTGQKWRTAEDHKLTDFKRPLASKQNLERYPAAVGPKMKEKNCACKGQQHQPAAREKLHHFPNGKAAREMDENSALPVSFQDKWRNVDQVYLTHRWQTVSHPAEKPWKASVPNPYGSNSEAKAQNKHKKSQPQSQGTRRDTRC